MTDTETGRPVRTVRTLPGRAAALFTAALAVTTVCAVFPTGPLGTAVTQLTGVEQASATSDGGVRAYFVITAPNATAGAKKAVTANKGRVYAAYDRIGVLVAHSANPKFATKLRETPGVRQVGATRTSAVPAEAGGLAREYGRRVGERQQAPEPNRRLERARSVQRGRDGEAVRWNMRQIKADTAWKTNTGSRKVLVGVLDTGVDDTHEDLKANFDAASSVSCAYGRADAKPGAWRPQPDVGGSEHGTHVAGIVAAARNGRGVTGVAPGARIAAVRLQEGPSGLFFPENTVCGFVWAAEHRMTVVNNSYYTDPWLFNCPSDLDQAAILEAVRRAGAYAESKGVLNVAAAGNESYDLGHKVSDDRSPNDSATQHRQISDECLSLPTELPGAVVVSATDQQRGHASYSNYGTGKISVAAPGGENFGGSVYSTLPGNKYGDMAGTSMAAPHVAGVAALLAATHPGATPTQLRRLLTTQATDLPCPQGDDRCSGAKAENSFFGDGLVNAASAVSAKPWWR